MFQTCSNSDMNLGGGGGRGNFISNYRDVLLAGLIARTFEVKRKEGEREGGWVGGERAFCLLLLRTRVVGGQASE